MSARLEASPTRSGYHHGDLHRALIEAARALMAEQRSWDFSLRELARRAGVSHNAPYKHFAGKSDLLAALAVDGFERLTASMTGAAAEATPDEAALELGLAYVRFGQDNPEQYRLMFGSGFRDITDAVADPVRMAAAKAKAVLRETILKDAEAAGAPFATSGETAETAMEVAIVEAWSVVHGLTMLFLDGLLDHEAAGVSVGTITETVLRRPGVSMGTIAEAVLRRNHANAARR